jgi:hypothetical protein
VALVVLFFMFGVVLAAAFAYRGGLLGGSSVALGQADSWRDHSR